MYLQLHVMFFFRKKIYILNQVAFFQGAKGLLLIIQSNQNVISPLASPLVIFGARG